MGFFHPGILEAVLFFLQISFFGRETCLKLPKIEKNFRKKVVHLHRSSTLLTSAKQQLPDIIYISAVNASLCVHVKAEA